ncbi:hypothetical protein FBF91_08405 [Campylobacter upsaliensis]|nr:hypothetical protein [Campylobacter upsaliensis]
MDTQEQDNKELQSKQDKLSEKKAKALAMLYALVHFCGKALVFVAGYTHKLGDLFITLAERRAKNEQPSHLRS